MTDPTLKFTHHLEQSNTARFSQGLFQRALCLLGTLIYPLRLSQIQQCTFWVQHIPCITWCTIMRKCACTPGEITPKNSQISADTWAYSWSYSHEVCNCYAKVCENLRWPPLIKGNVSPHWLPAKLKIRTTLGGGSPQSWEWAHLSVVVLCKPKNMHAPLRSGSLWSYVHVLRKTADGRKDK